MSDSQPDILWEATADEKKAAAISQYMAWLESKCRLKFSCYDDLYQWSIKKSEEFWRSMVSFYQLFDFPEEQPVITNRQQDFIGVRWFEGVTLNYAEMIFRRANDSHPAILFTDELNPAIRSVSWQELKKQVASLSSWMKSIGIQKGDRVAAVLPNTPEAVVAFLATQSIGAIWSSCSPDFGTNSILDRFGQIEPKLLFVTNQVSYNGKHIDKSVLVHDLPSSLPTLSATVLISQEDKSQNGCISWLDIMRSEGGELQFEPLPFDHPLWILYSSGTTGKPKAIVHSVGGNLIEHIKVLQLHWDVRPGERFFWYSTTGWMMWNFSVASLLTGATLVLYEGSPAYPSLGRIWEMAAATGVHHLGVGAAYLIQCQRTGLVPDPGTLPALRSIGSTGSPLTPAAFEWVYQSVKKDVWLVSFSGGTDICSGFVGGCMLLPVYRGEIQCRLLGCDLIAVNEKGEEVEEEVGEMVIRQPMPSMPLFFWKDEGDRRYRASYFEKIPGCWWHGDFISISARKGIVIYGRSDATLNRDGVRIGTAEIYRVVDACTSVADSLVVCIERKDGSFYMPLFVKMQEGSTYTDELQQEIKTNLRRQCSPRHVPDAIFVVPDIPYTISGKKMEIPVKRILMGTPPEKAADADTLRNPMALQGFAEFVSAV
ncbi:MAG: acetoacetate--CoA ligase [Chitinophagaceae bacterium]|nr:acetoacetate--CoA ligase [Chitinophagaceae bacterium]